MNRAGNERTGRQEIVIPVAAATLITEATMVAVNAEGYAVPASKTAGLVSAGVCQIFADNTSGADGDIAVPVRRGVFVMNSAGDIKATDILKKCYFKDATTVTMVSEGSSPAGTILQVDPDGITIDFIG